MGSIKNQLKTDDENFSLVMQLITSSILSHGLQVAIELDLFEIIAKAGPNAKLSPRDIVSHLSTQNPDAPIMLDRILRLLVSYSILNSSIVTNEDGLVESLYGLTPVGQYFVRNEDGVSMSPMMVLTQEKVFTSVGVEHVGGDMFASVPKGEAIFLKWILHDWSGESCLKLLKNCYKALPNQGKLIIVEAILPVATENDTAAKGICQMDLVMMTQNPGGKERTEEEFESMAKGAGFAGMKKVCRIYNYWVIEFYKHKH